MRVGKARREPGRELDEALGSLLRLEARDLDDERRAGGNPKLGAHASAARMGAKRREVDPRADHARPLLGKQPEPRTVLEVAPGNRDEGVGPARRRLLGREERPPDGQALVRPEPEPVNRVDHHRHALAPRRQAAQNTRLRGVGVHDVGTKAPDHASQLEVRAKVRPRPHLAPDLAELEELESARRRASGSSSPASAHASPTANSRRSSAVDGVERVALRAAELEHGDRVQDPEAAHGANLFAAVAPSHSASSIVEYFHSAHRPASTTPAARYASRSARHGRGARLVEDRVGGIDAHFVEVTTSAGSRSRPSSVRPSRHRSRRPAAGRPAGREAHLDRKRVASGRRNRPVVGGNPDAVEREALLRDVQPVLPARRRPADAEVQVNDGNGAQTRRSDPPGARQVNRHRGQVRQRHRRDERIPGHHLP